MSRITGPKHTKFLHNVDKSLSLLIHTLAQQYCHSNPLKNGSAQVSRPISPICLLKLVAMATSVKLSDRKMNEQLIERFHMSTILKIWSSTF